MSLDLRIPMGMMFTLVGAILVAFGIATDGQRIYAKSLGFNINLWWGLVLMGSSCSCSAAAARSGWPSYCPNRRNQVKSAAVTELEAGRSPESGAKALIAESFSQIRRVIHGALRLS